MPAAPEVVFDQWLDPRVVGEVQVRPRPVRVVAITVEPRVGGSVRFDVDDSDPESDHRTASWPSITHTCCASRGATRTGRTRQRSVSSMSPSHRSTTTRHSCPSSIPSCPQRNSTISENGWALTFDQLCSFAARRMKQRFDTADVYSNGAAEGILGADLRGRRDECSSPPRLGWPPAMGPGNGDLTLAAIERVEGSLRRLQTDHIDRSNCMPTTLRHRWRRCRKRWNWLVQQGKSAIQCTTSPVRTQSSRWLWPTSITATLRRTPGVLLLDRTRQWVGAHAVGARGGNRRHRLEPSRLGRLTGKVRRSKPLPERVVCTRLPMRAAGGRRKCCMRSSMLDEIAAETGKTAPQIALNWLLDRPTVSSVIIALRPRGRAGIRVCGANPAAGRMREMSSQ